MTFIGIDPGKQGVVAIYPEDSIEDIILLSCPIIEMGKGSKADYVEKEMVALLKDLVFKIGVFCVLEKVHSMPGQGVSSMFSMGEGLGIWRGILAAVGYPYELVTPQRWRKELTADISGDDVKAKSIIAAKRLFPNVSLKRTSRCKKDDDNFADALLLAEYARRSYRGKKEK